MPRSFFVPAQNSRHRIAAIALYRALVRNAQKVPLSTELQQLQQKGYRHPAVHLVRKRFEGNKSYVSLRLVYSSMAAGYKFLNLLTKAQSPESPEHAEVTEFLTKRSKETAARQAAKASQPARAPSKEPRTPLLTNIAKPGEAPTYVGNLRKPEIQPSPRRIPQITSSSHGYPFMRYTKPNPKALNDMIHKNTQLWISKINHIIEAEEELAIAARLEDRWEDNIQWEMMHAGMIEKGRPRTPPEETHVHSVMLSKLWYEWRLENMWQHWTARGEAMHDLVLKERALSEKEAQRQAAVGQSGSEQPSASSLKAQGLASQPDNLPLWPEEEDPDMEDVDLPSSSRETLQTSWGEHPGDSGTSRRKQNKSNNTKGADKVKLSTAGAMPALETANAVKKDLARRGIEFDERTHDPFGSPVWQEMVRRSDKRIGRWTARILSGAKGGDDSEDISAFLKKRLPEEE